MAYQHPGKDDDRRTAALVKAVDSALDAHNGANKTDAKNRISISLSHGKEGLARSPEEQAAYLLKGTNWTANSAHMADGAEHILVEQGGIVTWALSSLVVAAVRPRSSQAEDGKEERGPSLSCRCVIARASLKWSVDSPA